MGNLKVSDINSSQSPVFIDDDTEEPTPLPLMVTCHSLKSLGLYVLFLKEPGAQEVNREPLVGTCLKTLRQKA